jgi:hypothetical protein
VPEDVEGDEHAMALARSYQRMARSYRQTLVVQMRLRREAKAEAKADAGDVQAERRARRYELKAAIMADLRPRIWRLEREEERCEELDRLADNLIADAADRLDFLDLTPAAHVAAILPQLDLDAPDGDDAEPPDDPDDDDTDAAPAIDPDEDDFDTPPAEPPQAEAAEAQPPPEPPPRPPDKPYIPPWEQLRPGQSFPGSTGY